MTELSIICVCGNVSPDLGHVNACPIWQAILRPHWHTPARTQEFRMKHQVRNSINGKAYRTRQALENIRKANGGLE